MTDENLIESLLRTLDATRKTIDAFFEAARPFPKEGSMVSAERNAAGDKIFNIYELFGEVETAIRATVEARIRLFGSDGRAA